MLKELSRFIVLIAALGVCHCAPPRPGASAGAAQARLSTFEDAVRRKDARAVHGLLPEQEQRLWSIEEVARLLDDGGPELLRYIQDLRATAETGVVVVKAGREPAPAAASNATVLGAARALRAALIQEKEGPLLALLSPDLRMRLERSRDALILGLGEEEGYSIEETPVGARLRLGTGVALLFRREQGHYLLEAIE